jgi:GntR family transcriptional regulator, transcriptional repressor for pyruvate dehydrogenase complex
MKVLVGMLRLIIDTATFSKVARDAGTPSERIAQHVGHRSHRRLLEYVEGRDAERASRLWRKHILETSGYLLSETMPSTVLELLE